MQYSTQLLEHFDRTSFAGALDLSSDDVWYAREGCVDNGEVVELYLQLKQDCVQNARFLAHGSPALIACTEFLCQWLMQKTMTQLAALTPEVLLSALALPVTRIHVALLCVSAVEKLIKDYYEQTNQPNCLEASLG